jgi:hypothetical protein
MKDLGSLPDPSKIVTYLTAGRHLLVRTLSLHVGGRRRLSSFLHFELYRRVVTAARATGPARIPWTGLGKEAWPGGLAGYASRAADSEDQRALLRRPGLGSSGAASLDPRGSHQTSPGRPATGSHPAQPRASRCTHAPRVLPLALRTAFG